MYGGRPGFFSSDKLGFRCIQYAATDADRSGERIEITAEVPVYSPSSAQQFTALADAYRYEKIPLDARLDESTDTPDWKREKISFTGTNGARAVAYLYLPHHVARPLQVLHYMPAADVDGGFRPLQASIEERMAPYIRTGRAVFGVVLDGYFERRRPNFTRPASSTAEFADYVVNRILELRRGLDYLETRQDIDMTRIGIVGPSAGSSLGLIISAIEPRYRALILVGAGLPASYRSIVTSANPIYFAPHIKIPKLLVQGRYDEDTPLQTATEPLFKLMVQPKRLTLYDGGHVPSVEVTINATKDWLDESLGRVAR
jgi:pimeloyl-ACP methyl ester carboxylesterase